MWKESERLSPALGIAVHGVDRSALGDEGMGRLYRLWLEHHVLVLRDCPLTEEELIEFGRHFGPIEMARKKSALASHPEIMVISNIREGSGEALGALPDGELFWHFDRIHQAKPNKAGVLHAIELPSAGGETRFSNMCAAYDALPNDMKDRITGLTALSTYQYGQTRADRKQLASDSPSAVHPVVRTIPETGRKALYVCRLMTDRITELPEDESVQLLSELFDHAEQERFVYEHTWRTSDVVVWDNRCVLHARNDFNENERRLLKRVTVGDTTIPAP